MDYEPDRRSVLRTAAAGAGGLGLAALGLGGGLMSACQQEDAPHPIPTEIDWRTLDERLTGPLLRPTDPDYAVASMLFDPAFDAVRPQAVVRAMSAGDVTACIDFARSTGIHLVARAGGHSYGGYSTTTGLVVDVTAMASVRPGPDGTALIGAGALLIDVYSALAENGLALPAGSCPTVGIAGLALGGGIGVLSRRYGLTCDRMVSAEVVLASGETVRTDADTEPDLFWSLRGAGGGNVGIVTSFTFATHRATPLALFTYRWPWDVAADVLTAWQGWIADSGGAPEDLWSTCVVTSMPTTGATGSPALRVSGVLAGGADDTRITWLRDRLADLVAAVGRRPSSTFVAQRGHLETMLLEAGCAGKSVDACHLRDRTPGGTLPRVAQRAASAFLTEPMPAGGIETMLAALERRQRTPGAGPGGVILDSWGGAINRVGPGDTAFVHRNTLASAQFVAGYSVDASPADKEANQSWLRSTVAATAPFMSSSAYQNYIDPDLTTWADAYYGANLPRLRQVKRAYDPDNLFRFAQSIAPS
ncbi:twin-arginine translocation pathway signal protein [Frankia sp. CcI156]|uniref:Twin-arginine translocation pathway signal n=1 Tax=Frankia casuarinae (strain DSM 45818 / CECT 9043 / HFP020203 / CcI3) TaxID=106370 RepID=Q2JH05_FRACC|nr:MULTISPECIES: FAD-binding oxidoreductase [Frankia]ABD09437.1 Twin-arginine translocation pathway signal [Frankia casuarinae]ETA02764.1 FAD/FMN-dependent dehydrogenase [Frankia sp. CcI6]EYT94163.1 FAD/FMN-dependent dehydrogenase [Frankia casuarinae]KDA44355.1 FAD/FMN-dependent dehydrogenase [Frankia sp. BMG5.23]KEZ35045.1 FAD/FMN-dependent dehydrogenase [Frankia sp. CeD]